MRHRYSELLKEKWNRGERWDCAVRAVAAALNLPYGEAHALLKLHGRRDKDGTNWHTVTFPAIKAYGYHVEDVTAHWPKVKTYITAKRHLDKTKTYLIHTKAHIAAYVEGTLFDRVGRSRILRIREVYKI
jgi:hypothetical protein